MSIPVRPTEWDEEVQTSVLAQILPAVSAWYIEESGIFEEDEERSVPGKIRDEVLFLITLNENGYELAKRCDGKGGWPEVNAKLVNILDQVSDIRRTAVKFAVRRWVTKWDVRPRLGVGAKVVYLGKLGQSRISMPRSRPIGSWQMSRSKIASVSRKCHF